MVAVQPAGTISRWPLEGAASDLAGHLLCALDVPILGRFVATTQHDDDRLLTHDDVRAVPRAHVDLLLADAIGHRRHVAEKPVLQLQQPRRDRILRSAIARGIVQDVELLGGANLICRPSLLSDILPHVH